MAVSWGSLLNVRQLLMVFLSKSPPCLISIIPTSGISVHLVKQFQNLRIIFNLLSHVLVIKSYLLYFLNISQTCLSLYPHPSSSGL